MILSTQNGLFKFKFLIFDLMKEIIPISMYGARGINASEKVNNIEFGAINEADRKIIEAFIRQGSTRAYEILTLLANGVILPTSPGAKQTETISLAGPSGTGTSAYTGGLTPIITFVTDLTTTASNFAAANASAYAALDIGLSSIGNTLVFQSLVSGQPFVAPAFSQVTGNLSGIVAHTTANVSKTSKAFSWREAGTESKDAVVFTIGQKDWMADTIEVTINDKILETIKEYTLREWYTSTNQIDDAKIHADKFTIAINELNNACHMRKKQIINPFNPL